MEQKPRNAAHAEIVDYEMRAAHEHHHRGKSSESLLDKEAIFAALRITPGQTVLDAGCRNGYMSKEFSKLVVRECDSGSRAGSSMTHRVYVPEVRRSRMVTGRLWKGWPGNATNCSSNFSVSGPMYSLS